MRIRDWINLVIVTLIAGTLGVTFPDIRGALIALWTLFVLGYTLVLLGNRLGGLVRGSRFDKALIRHPRRSTRPEDLQRCEHTFGWKSYTPRDFKHEVEPQLDAIVAHRTQGAIDDDLLSNQKLSTNEPDELRSIRTQDIARIIDKIERL